MRFLISVITAALIAVITPSIAQASDHVSFVPEASSATLTDSGVRVVFVETGLSPGETAQIAVAVKVKSTVTCRAREGGPVLLRFSSTASALESTTYVADETGTISAERLLRVRPGTVEITGWSCTTDIDATATLTDVGNGATLVLPVSEP